jgi:hypothetical protein
MKYTKRLANSLVAISAAISFLLVGANLHAQPQPGRAEVKVVIGTAYFSAAPGAAMEPLKEGIVLGPGATIKTTDASVVDLFLGKSAGMVRVTQNTTLALDRLTIADTGADTVVEIQLNVPEGTILGNVEKLATASKFEIKVPNGVAGIRGTQFRISSSSLIVLTKGSLVFVYVAPGAKDPVPYTLVAPPGVYFSPIEGVKPAPAELVAEVEAQFKSLGQHGQPGRQGQPPGQRGNPDPGRGHKESNMSPH